MYTWTLSLLVVQRLPKKKLSSRFQRHIAAALLLLILGFYGGRLPLSRSPSWPLSAFPSRGLFFPPCGLLDYSSVIVLVSVSDKVTSFLSLQPPHTHTLSQGMRWVCLLLSTSKSPRRLSPLHLFQFHVLIFISRAARGEVLTLGGVQICGLRGWTAVIRAKNNSPAPTV